MTLQDAEAVLRIGPCRDPLVGGRQQQCSGQNLRIRPVHLDLPLVDQLLDLLQGVPLGLETTNLCETLKYPLPVEAMPRRCTRILLDKSSDSVIVDRLTRDPGMGHHLSDLEQFRWHLTHKRLHHCELS